MKENFVATLFKSIVINNDTYLFIPIHVIEGKYSQDAEVFMDNLENTYYDMKDVGLAINNKSEFYGFPVSIQDIKEYFATEDNLEAMKKYFENICENVYLGTNSTDTNEIEIISIPLTDLKNITTANIKEINNPEPEEESVRIFLNEDGLNKMLNMESLEEIKDYLTQALKFSNEVNKIAKELKEETNINNAPAVIIPGRNLDVQDMYNYIISKVINQNEAVRQILMTFIMNNITVNSNFLLDLQLTRTLITGNTGSGKTLILESIIEYLEHYTNFNIPMVKVPMSQLLVQGMLV